jgi:phenylpropionate dioxygenase-like ring-hydroxylating dioxygenase large terminal subunit
MTDLPKKLQPPDTKSHTSVVQLTRAWYVAGLASELKSKPIARTILGIPMVLFRGRSGNVSIFLDRCPHRNVPLSMGSVRGDHLECGYHGWQFSSEGDCVKVPGLATEVPTKGKCATAYPCREQDGYIWVWPDTESKPSQAPYSLELIGKPGYATIRHMLELEGSVHATIENALDVPHTAFLHSGLFRKKGSNNPIEAIIRRKGTTVEAEFIGEPAPKGLMGRILAPKGGCVEHYDRFILPSIAQVEYRMGEKNHIMATSFCTPISDFKTRLYGVANIHLPAPNWLLSTLVKPIALTVLKQDARVLKAQSDTIRRFGGEQFESTQIDVLGAYILRLLKEAQRGEVVDVPETELRRTTLYL